VTTATRIFVARVAGIPVFDPNGDQVGRVRDAVARPRAAGVPRVVGLVAEMPLRRRIFMPIGICATWNRPESLVIATTTLPRARTSAPGMP